MIAIEERYVQQDYFYRARSVVRYWLAKFRDISQFTIYNVETNDGSAPLLYRQIFFTRINGARMRNARNTNIVGEGKKERKSETSSN